MFSTKLSGFGGLLPVGDRGMYFSAPGMPLGNHPPLTASSSLSTSGWLSSSLAGLEVSLVLRMISFSIKPAVAATKQRAAIRSKLEAEKEGG
jgi:hypothetical protein